MEKPFSVLLNTICKYLIFIIHNVNFSVQTMIILVNSKKSATFAADFHEEIIECGVEQR